jgi:hypothetical protein
MAIFTNVSRMGCSKKIFSSWKFCFCSKKNLFLLEIRAFSLGNSMVASLSLLMRHEEETSRFSPFFWMTEWFLRMAEWEFCRQDFFHSAHPGLQALVS